MLSSPLVRRLVLLSGGFGIFWIVIVGLVSLSVPGTEQVATLRFRIITAEIILLVLGVLMLRLIALRWIIPLIELKQASRLMAEGQRPERVAADFDDELGQLTQVYNEMIQNVNQRTDELQRSRQRVASDNQQLATVLEAMVEGVIAVDQDERILLANPAAIRLLNLKAFNVVGQRIWEAIRIPHIQEMIRGTLAESTQRRLEFAVPWTNSTVAVVATRLPGNPCPGAVIVLHDVTELRKLENLRREFVSNVSHELKTPLAAITAYADTLLGGALEERDVCATFITRISEQSERLHSLILDLLELARIESGEHAFHVDRVSINPILTSCIESHRAIAKSKELSLSILPCEDELFAMVDSEGLRTIVENLISNSINYTRPGGTIIVESRREGEWVVVDVEDNGVGIAKEFQSRIFERFYRVDRARSREVGGTGLGLSIVKHLCQLFGGTIKVKSQLGHGSTFSVYLRSG